jgi:hypothetical protein
MRLFSCVVSCSTNPINSWPQADIKIQAAPVLSAKNGASHFRAETHRVLIKVFCGFLRTKMVAKLAQRFPSEQRISTSMPEMCQISLVCGRHSDDAITA